MSIISAKYKFIFVHIEKNAGTTISRALCSDPGIIYQRAKKLRGKKVYGGDFSARQYIKLYGIDVWNEYNSFCIIRNPWDRMLSWFHYLKRKRAIPNTSVFYDWLSDYDFQSKDNQLSMISDDNGNIIVKRIARYENLNSDCQDILTDFNIFINPFVRHHNASRTIKDKENWRDEYDTKAKDLVYRRYKKEINLFGYMFD